MSETQKIKVEIETEVPVGEYCWKTKTSYSYKDDTKITSVKTEVEKCEKLINSSCTLFPMTPAKEGEMSVGVSCCSFSPFGELSESFTASKCPACLNACNNGTERHPLTEGNMKGVVKGQQPASQIPIAPPPPPVPPDNEPQMTTKKELDY